MFRVTKTSSGRLYIIDKGVPVQISAVTADDPTLRITAATTPSAGCPPPHITNSNPFAPTATPKSVGNKHHSSAIPSSSSSTIVKELGDRPDLDMVSQRAIARQYQNQRIHERNCKSYENTIAPPLLHYHFLRALLNEAHVYQLGRLKRQRNSLHQSFTLDDLSKSNELPSGVDYHHPTKVAKLNKCLSRLGKTVQKAYQPLLFRGSSLSPSVVTPSSEGVMALQHGGQQHQQPDFSCCSMIQQDPYLGLIHVIQKQRLWLL